MLKSRKNSRWGRELQRRLGSSAMWLMVSFTGRMDLDVLQQLKDVGSSQTDEATREPTQSFKFEAQKARDRLRHAESLHRRQQTGRRKLSDREQAELALLADGSLRREANDATLRSGFGRIRLPDGGFEDITQHGGGMLKTVLDDWLPNIEAAGKESGSDEERSLYVD